MPGGNFFILGTKSGDLEIYDVGSAKLLEKIKAHSGSIWSICFTPDRNGLVSGGSDKTVKFWNFSFIKKSTLKKDEEENKKTSSDEKNKYLDFYEEVLTLVLDQTIEMSDDVLCVNFSPNGKFLAVSLLDSTVKLFFSDSMNFFLSLYGHKLPVLSFDISSDNTLIATGILFFYLFLFLFIFFLIFFLFFFFYLLFFIFIFIFILFFFHLIFFCVGSADKNIKIWGMDFGDCHKSIWAHDDSVTKVKFIPDTHILFTASKDGSIKMWDGKKKF